ncbi:hypothetical protein H1W37_19640 [Stappia taiwanensis]|uniref:Uncharacterized protein n=1 Tax=Stappia taiwanensis TaxID=992267 RepID=A0A838XVW7_9HYPH|nr:hypothetical protein [Stappia taiwanensis]MBA4613877.1 hypothetical protein [Stappia taiwanensis]GGF07551.1 hypothetical protein GCM10007285_39330 [Stappia taiwanensis]
MTVYESKLTLGNFTPKGTGSSPHIYITPFYRDLPADVFGGRTRNDPAPRTIRLEFGSLVTDTDVPTDKGGRPRLFFRDRRFVREFFDRTGAAPGDSVLFQRLSPYHLRLSLRTTTGRIVTP